MIRLATLKDIDRILEIYAIARRFMASTGNPNQWPDDSYPSRELLIEDIALGRLYCLEEAKMIEGVFMFSTEKDPTYSVIVDGEWPNDEPYGVIHRIASSGRVKGVLAKCVEFAKKSADNLRIDTHEENAVMQSALSKLGFEKCGIIFLENGDPRIAFQLIVNK